MADDLPLPPWAHSHDAALYRGDFIQVMHLKQEESIQVLCDAPNPMTNDIHAMSRTRASAAVSARLVLRAASLLEGWGVLLSRWVLEAAATGNAQPGSADAFFESCRPALNPSAKQLLAAVHATGHVSRFNVSRAIGQCAAHQDLWATLGARTATATFGHGAAVATSNGIDEHTRLYWTPLHFAAAFGSIDVVEGLLALHPRNVSIANGAGFSPLHVAVSHDAIGPAATLASLPFTTDVVDNVGRTPAALALEVLPSVSRCRAMLAALNEVATGALTRQARRECARAASYRKERNAQVRRVPPRHLPLACANGGGWASEDGNDATCGTDALPRGGTVSDDGDDDVDDDDDSDGGGSDGGGSGGGGRRREQHTRSKEKRRCDIPIAEDVNAADLIHEFLVSGSPILVTNGASASELYSRWRMPSFVHAHGGVTVSPEPYPYAHASAALYGVPTDNSTTVAQLLASDDAHGLLRHGVFNALQAGIASPTTGMVQRYAPVMAILPSTPRRRRGCRPPHPHSCYTILSGRRFWRTSSGCCGPTRSNSIWVIAPRGRSLTGTARRGTGWYTAGSDGSSGRRATPSILSGTLSTLWGHSSAQRGRTLRAPRPQRPPRARSRSARGRPPLLGSRYNVTSARGR